MSTSQKYYRNKIPLGDIDKDSLWRLDGTNLVLVDEDQHICVDYEKENFYQVPPPKELS